MTSGLAREAAGLITEVERAGGTQEQRALTRPGALTLYLTSPPECPAWTFVLPAPGATVWGCHLHLASLSFPCLWHRADEQLQIPPE